MVSCPRRSFSLRSKRPTTVMRYLLWGTFAMIISTTGIEAQDCENDNDPPVVTCSNQTLLPPFVNIFFGLSRNAEGGYTYSDPHEPGNAIRYSRPISFNGYRYPPGATDVTLIAIDTCGNQRNCTFQVINTLTELPIICPDLNDTVTIDSGDTVYAYALQFGPSNVTASPGIFYKYVGGNEPIVDVSINGESFNGRTDLRPGSHDITVLVRDGVLNKSCSSYLTVEGQIPTTTSPMVPKPQFTGTGASTDSSISLISLTTMDTVSSSNRNEEVLLDSQDCNNHGSDSNMPHYIIYAVVVIIQKTLI